MSEWIKVVDRLPPNDGHEVLVSDGHYIGVGICKYKWSQRRAWTQEAVWYKWNHNAKGRKMQAITCKNRRTLNIRRLASAQFFKK